MDYDYTSAAGVRFVAKETDDGWVVIRSDFQPNTEYSSKHEALQHIRAEMEVHQTDVRESAQRKLRGGEQSIHECVMAIGNNKEEIQ